MIMRNTFFAVISRDLFKGSMTKKQTLGTAAILDEWDKRRLTDARHLAYMLATAFHETAFTMQPIAEIGRGRGRKYGVKGKHGQVAYGRGYVQLTWDYNYEKADRKLLLGGALTRNYDLAMSPPIAAAIMFEGMAEGWFTGKKLSDYFNATRTDWVNARRIINGTDKAQTIAGYAKTFHAALVLAATGDAPAPVPPPVSKPIDAPYVPPPVTKPAERPSAIAAVLVILAGVAAWFWQSIVGLFNHVMGVFQ